MSFATEHMLLQWTGHFITGTNTAAETFVGSLRFYGPNLDAANNDETATAMSLVLQDFWKTPAAAIPTRAQLQLVKWNKIGRDGRYVSKTSTRAVGANLQTGTQDLQYPFFVCAAATYTTAVKRGRARAGRTYWPTALRVSQSDGNLAEGALTTFAGTVETLIARLNTAANGGGTVPDAGGGGTLPNATDPISALRACVMSNIGEGTTAVITGGKVGNVLDVQRRRKNQIKETYYSSAGLV
jgi:hypothetical protein